MRELLGWLTMLGCLLFLAVLCHGCTVGAGATSARAGQVEQKIQGGDGAPAPRSIVVPALEGQK